MRSSDVDVGFAGLSDGELLEHVSDLVAEHNRAAARLARAVRAAENRQAAEHDGLKSMKSWLRTHGRLSGAAIAGLVREGRAMEQLPAVEAAFLAGAVTADQVDAIAEIVRPENLDRATAHGIELAVVERTLLDVATSQQHAKLQTAVGHYLARLDPDGREPDPTEQRSLTVVQHPDGAVTLGGSLDQHGGETVMTALEAVAAASRCAGETRTRAQRMADALVQLCATALATGSVPQLRSTPAQLVVMIDEADLVAAGNEPAAAVTGTGAVLSAAKARRIACDSQVSRIVFGPGSVPTDLGRTRPCAGPRRARSAWWGAQGCFPSPAAERPTGGPRHITFWSGSSTGRPTWTTSACSANAITPRSITGSASNDNPTADGAPTAPTAPRSSPAPLSSGLNPRLFADSAAR